MPITDGGAIMRAVTEPTPTTQAQLLAVIESIDEGLVISDRHGNVVTINHAAQHFLGDGWVPGARHHVSEFPSVLELSTLDGRVLTLPERPMARVLRGESFTGVELRLRQIATGIEMIASFAGAAVLDQAGEVDLAVLTGRDITAQKLAEQGLHEASRQKDDFLAVLGHELRNPLAPIVAGAQMLLRTAGLGEREQRLAEMIHRQARHLTRLVDDLLDVSRITQGKISIRREWLDLAAVARETVDDHRPEIESAGLALEVHIADTPIPVQGDPTRLAQVLANLLSNARKFTPPPGRIRASLMRDGTFARLTVTDTGIGIDPDDLPMLFEAMRRPSPTQDVSAGLGLGLALSRLLVEMHGGHITASSGGRGKGATFVLELPLVQ